MSTLRVAFVGFRHGHIFGLHEAFSRLPGVEIAGCFEQDEQARADAEKRGVEFCYQSLEEVLADKSVDVVAVGDYFAARGQICLKALQAGKHVLADKPLCTDLTELELIRKESEKSGKVVGMCLSLRQDNKIAAACRAIRDGMLGQVNNIIFEGQHPLNYGSRPAWYFEEGLHGGVITDIAVHGIDMARRLTGCNVQKVYGARCWNHYAKEVPHFKDSAQLMAQMENGAGIIGDVSYAAPSSFGYSHPSYWHFRVFGDKGMMDFGCNTEAVTCYLADESEPVVLPALTECGQEYDEFLDAVAHPEKAAAYTADILDVMEQTLQIQKYADTHLA